MRTEGDAMEHYSYLFCELKCPMCGARFEDNQGHVRFFWGRLGIEYHLGDRIQWPGKKRGAVAQGRRALRPAEDVRGFSGYARVYVFDNDDDYSVWLCRQCQTRFDRPAILIENDRIMSATLFSEDEVKEKLGIERDNHDVFFFDPITRQWMVFDEN